MADWQESNRQTPQEEDNYYSYNDDPRDPTVRLIEEGLRTMRQAQKANKSLTEQKSAHTLFTFILIAVALVILWRGCGG